MLPGDVVLDVFTELDTSAGLTTAQVRLVRSTDHGNNWSGPITIGPDLQALGTSDPKTGKGVRDGADIVSVSVAPGGVVYVAWQDSRFSGGQHDGIALSHSADGGLTWSTPVAVNADASVQAFTPTVHVDTSGVVAVTYYDLRNNAAAFFGLFLADCWMVTSSDGTTFQETHLSGPFDLDEAPDANGLFLGDYQSLSSAGGSLLPFYVQTDAAGAAVHTDAFIALPPAPGAAHAASLGAGFAARAAPGAGPTAAVRERLSQRIALRRAQRRLQP